MFLICYIFDFQEYAIIIAGIAAIISTITTYYNCDKVVLTGNKIDVFANVSLLKDNNTPIPSIIMMEKLRT